VLKTIGLTIGQCSGCAIFIDNKISFASSEERYSRIKSDESYPLNSINDGLKFCNLRPQQIDQVLIAGKKINLVHILTGFYTTFSVEDHLNEMKKYWYPRLIKGEDANFLKLFRHKISKNKFPFNSNISKIIDIDNAPYPPTPDFRSKICLFLEKTISNHLGTDESKINYIDHHRCHASYGFYGSPIREDNTLIFTADAWGDDLSGTISIYDKQTKRINRVKEYCANQFQLGRIFRYTTLLLRMLPNEHEYKVMGLAPYYHGSKVSEVERVFHSMLTLEGLDFKFNSDIKDIFHYLENNLCSYRFDHIAAGLQSFTEKILSSWFEEGIKQFNSNSVVFSGGVAYNVKANLIISKLSKIKNFFVCGGGGDESISMGACYAFAEDKNIGPKPLEDLYLGPKCVYEENFIEKYKKFKIIKFEDEDQIVSKLLEGKIIATCLGRMEMGPRALGNRSILADPRNSKNIEKINTKIKNRDFWMPFAPVVLEEYSDELISNPKKLKSPFMTIAFETINGKDKIPAAVHGYDGTARPLILNKESNIKIWRVVNKFYERTGIPALVNTSFNLHGEPIVNTINDAFYVFEKSDLDLLWLDEHIVEKNQKSNIIRAKA